MIKVFVDAAFKQSNQTSAIGWLMIHNGNQHVFKQKVNAVDNHAAEFIALQKVLDYLKTQQLTSELIQINLDSQIVYDSVAKKYAKKYADQLAPILVLIPQFHQLYINLIADKKNQGAHQLALQALNEENKK